LPDNLVSSIKIIGGGKLGGFMDLALRKRSFLESIFLIPKIASPIRRIVYFADKEGKTRVVALGDYFSQAALKRFHSYLFKVLKKIPQDMTFNQGAFVEKVRSWDSNLLYSVDLSAATDRFPISIISLVLRGHFPQVFVDA
jgi:hypothetical protein